MRHNESAEKAMPVLSLPKVPLCWNETRRSPFFLLPILSRGSLFLSKFRITEYGIVKKIVNGESYYIEIICWILALV